MSTPLKPTSIPKLRTFAHDLETMRAAKHRTAPKAAAVTDTKKTNAQKPADPIHPLKRKPPAMADKKPTAVTHTPKVIVAPAPERTVIAPALTAPHALLKETSVHTVENLQENKAHIKSTTKNRAEKSGDIDKEVRDASYDANIITDTKHNRFHLGGEVLKSIADWFRNFKKNRAASRVPKYTVPRAERRKGVIQRATSSTARTTTADHEAVLQRIKENKNEVERATAAATPKPVETIAPEIRPIEKTEISIPIITYRKNATPTIVGPVEEIAGEEAEPSETTEEEEVLLYEEENTETPSPEPIVVTPITLAPIEPSIPGDDTSNSTVVSTQIADEQPAPRKKRQFKMPTTALFRNLIENPNQLALLVLSGVTVIFVGYIGVQSFIGTTTETGPVVMEESILFTDAIRYQSVFIATNKQTMFDQISSYKDVNTPIFEVVFTGPDTTEEIPVSTILEMLGTSLPADFVAEIESIVFGYYREEPWLVLQTNNKNTAYGGMLRWEPELSYDLEPWFGPAVQKPTTGQPFKDGVIEATDVRVLQGTDGRERITYGFVGQNNILITTNTTAFLNLKANLPQ